MAEVAANSNWETFQLSVSFNTQPSDEARLLALKETVNALRSNVIELRAKKLFLAGIANVTDAENVLPSAKQISKIEEANAAARHDWAECARHAVDNFGAAHKAIEALGEAYRHADGLAKDLAARKAELATAAAQVRLLEAAEAAAADEAAQEHVAGSEVARVAAGLEQLSGVRVEGGAAGPGAELRVALLGLEGEPALLLRLERAGGRAVLRGARLEPPGAAAVDDLVACAVALDDAALLVQETRGRLRAAAVRRSELAALAKRHLLFEQGPAVRVTFPSGAMAALETGPDYPLGVGGVRLAALDSMGLLPDSLEDMQRLVAPCATLSEAVDTLAAALLRRK